MKEHTEIVLFLHPITHMLQTIGPRYPKLIHMSKLIFCDARQWMATMVNLVLQQTWLQIKFVSSNFQFKTHKIKKKLVSLNHTR